MAQHLDISRPGESMLMNRRTRTLTVAVVLLAALFAASDAGAQASHQPTPAPIVTGENTPWYLAGEPITFAGNIYYPAGPQVFFNRYEMVRSGFYEGVPLYTRTTLEPYSVVFVPVGGGLMQPYERRRAGDVAGTVGSTTPAFPVITPPEEDDVYLLPQAASPPTRVAISIGDTTRELTDLSPGAPAAVRTPAVGTAGSAVPSPTGGAPIGSLRSALRPQGINAVFIQHDNRRWFNAGPAVDFSPTTFVQVGDYHGFPVYKESGKEDRIYVASKATAGAPLTPYSLK